MAADEDYPAFLELLAYELRCFTRGYGVLRAHDADALEVVRPFRIHGDEFTGEGQEGGIRRMGVHDRACAGIRIDGPVDNVFRGGALQGGIVGVQTVHLDDVRGC